MRHFLLALAFCLFALLAHLIYALALVRLGALVDGFLFFLWAPFFAVTYLTSFLLLVHSPGRRLVRFDTALLIVVCIALPVLHFHFLPDDLDMILIVALEMAMLTATLAFLWQTLRLARREGLQRQAQTARAFVRE